MIQGIFAGAVWKHFKDFRKFFYDDLRQVVSLKEPDGLVQDGDQQDTHVEGEDHLAVNDTAERVPKRIFNRERQGQ